MMIWVTSSNWKQIKYSWNIYIQFAKFDECINTLVTWAKNVWFVICIHVYTRYQFARLGCLSGRPHFVRSVRLVGLWLPLTSVLDRTSRTSLLVQSTV